MRAHRAYAFVIASAVAATGAAGTAAADGVADFYKDKTITVLVGSSPGGGYDGDARTVARHLGQFIPGKPNVIVQNMPGARGLVATNYLYNVAPKDGTVMDIMEREHLIDPYLMPDNVRYDERKFTWIGSSGSEEGVSFAWHTAPQKTMQDIQKTQFIVGGASNSAILPAIYNHTLGTRYKLIQGYTGSESVLLAMLKGEVQGIANYSLSNLFTKHRDWLMQHKIHIFFQTGKTRNAALPDVPLVTDFAQNDEKRKVLDLWLSPNEVARPFAMPPGVPIERRNAVRKAFMALFRDPQFLADAKQTGMAIDPEPGEYIEELVRRLRAYPPSVIAAAKAAAIP